VSVFVIDLNNMPINYRAASHILFFLRNKIRAKTILVPVVCLVSDPPSAATGF